MKKTALVTGGLRGIGLGISQALAEEGYNLATNGVRAEEDVQEAMDGLRERGAEVIYCRGMSGTPRRATTSWSRSAVTSAD